MFGDKGMRPPARIQVLGVDYTVVLDGSRLAEFNGRKRGRYAGYSDHQTLEIVLDPSVSESSRRGTLWHELKHCVLPLYKPGLSDFNAESEMDFDEWYIALSGPGELAVLRQNPDLVAYLLAAE